MKIFYLITKSELGGAQTHVVQLCNYFKNKGANIAVMSYPGGWLEDEAKKIGVKFFSNAYFSNSPNPLKIWLAAKEIKKVLDNFKPNIVHCHGSAAGVLGRLVVRGKVKTIFTAHGWSFNKGVQLWQKMFGVVSEKICGLYTAKIIAVCNFVKDYGVKYHVAAPDKFMVIFNGIEVVDGRSFDFPAKAGSLRMTSSQNKIKLVFVGRLAAPKDPFLLVKALADSNIKDKIELNIIGSGPQEGLLLDKIKSLGLAQVKLLGALPRTQVFDILSQSDIFVLTTDWEGFPYAILEAMSCGLPVIATDVGGISEAVTADIGILVKKGNVGELKIALEKLVLDSEMRQRMGKAAQEKVLRDFSLNKMFLETEKIYEKI
ncbi:MAG: glycosyltransferase family 4 protein [Candidatus Magasanikbacteria bacterium]